MITSIGPLVPIPAHHSKQVRYAVIGLGYIAQAAMLPAFAHAKRNSRLVALVSGTPRKLKALGDRYRIAKRCSYREAGALFESGDIDAVYIALPNDQHKEWTVRAARAGLHVLCEKPMAVSTQDCQIMMQAAKAARVKLMIAYRLHFDAASIDAALTARSGRLGALRFFSSDFAMQVRGENIRLRGGHRGGGPLYDIGIYCINAARMSFGEPRSVLATATRSRDARFRHVEESVSAVMRYEDERLAAFNCSFGSADRSTYTLTGSRGSLTVDPAYEYAKGLTSTLRLGDRRRTRKFAKRDQFAAELAYFSDCILKDRIPEPGGLEGLADIRIIEAMHRSIKNGRWTAVPTPPRKRKPTRRQDIRRPAVPREPKLVEVASASQ